MILPNVAISQIEFYLFFWIFPIAAVLFFGLFILFVFILFPDESRLLLKLRFNKKASLGLIAGDDGILHFELLTDEGLGAFKSSKGNRRYLFLVRPLFKSKSTIAPDSVELENKSIDPNNIDISDADRAIIEETLLKRHVLYSIKKPVYIGYTGKAVLTGLAALSEVSKANSLERTAEELGVDVDDVKKLLAIAKRNEEKKTGKDKRQAVTDYVNSYLSVLDPRIWKQYFKRTSNQPTIDALCYTHEQIGAGDKQPLPLMMILILVVLILGGFMALKYLKVI